MLHEKLHSTEPLYPACSKIFSQTGANTFGHNSPGDRELFKSSKDAESLLVLVEKVGSFGFELFCG